MILREIKYGVSIFRVCVLRDFEISKFVFTFSNWTIYFFFIANRKNIPSKNPLSHIDFNLMVEKIFDDNDDSQ